MRVPVDWLRELAEIPDGLDTSALADRLTAVDLKLEEIDVVGGDVAGPLVVGRVLTAEPETHSNGKTVRWCQVDVGPVDNDPGHHDPAKGEVPAGRGIVCGAPNVAAGDLVVVALPGTTLPGGFEIAARKTYGHVSDGMICSPAELGLPGDSGGILVLDEADGTVPGADATALLGLRQEVLDLEINPDRAYALSLRGVARDAGLALGVPSVDPAGALDPVGDGEDYPVRVEDPEACPVFVTRTVTGFDPTRPSPSWLARRVELAGMRSISLAVDVTNYVMLELGQPIHGYDRSKLRGPIVVRTAEAGERLTTLDDVQRTLSPDDLLICDDRGPIGLAGVMGGADVELGPETTDIVIEAAHFRPVTIARTSRLQKLPSEASRRFERGVDPALPPRAAQRVAELLVEHGGGRIEPGLTVVGEAPQRPVVELEVDLSSRVAGFPIAPGEVVAAIEGNGCEVEVVGETLRVVPPSWRFDLNDPNDIAEEVLRHVGYHRVPSVLPVAPAGRGLSREQTLRRRVAAELAGAGLVEVKPFPFAGPADFDRLGLPIDDVRRRQVLLENPLSAERPGMTTTLLAGLLATAELNVGRGHADVSTVEIGRVFLPRADSPAAPIPSVEHRPSESELAGLDAALPDQPHHVAAVLVGERMRSGWTGSGRPVAWSDAVALARRVAGVAHVVVTVEAAERAPWHPGRCAAVVVDGSPVGYAGELHPRVARAYGLPGRVAAVELDLDVILAAAPPLGPRPEFSTYPVAKEDLALVVDATIPVARLETALRSASPLIESVRLFDLYTGEQVGEGRRSLAFALRLRAPDRTLTEEEIREVRAVAVAAAEAEGATLRS